MAVTDKDLLRKKILGDLKNRHEALPPLPVDVLEGFFESIDDESTRKAASIGCKK